MVKDPVDDKTAACVGALQVLLGAAFGLGALLTSGDGRSVFGALASFMIMSGAFWEYMGHRGRVWRAMRAACSESAQASIGATTRAIRSALPPSGWIRALSN
jgi:hypothetical protein